MGGLGRWGASGGRKQVGTRGSQAAAGFSVLVVFLLLKLGHQTELPTAAAFGKVQRHILWRRARNTASARAHAVRGARTAARGGAILCFPWFLACLEVVLQGPRLVYFRIHFSFCNGHFRVIRKL